MPIDVADGQIVTAAGRDLIAQSIWLILSTAKGELVTRPDFGSDLPDLVFAPVDTNLVGRVGTAVGDALALWEPRIDVENVAVTIEPSKGDRILISIDYRVRATNSRFNMVYPFYLEEAP